jgi:hypothetical protein
MSNRNLKFYGFAYGDTPVTLDVKIDGQTVFSNTVNTIAGDLPVDPASVDCDQVLFEVNNTDLFPITFGGSYIHSISVSGGNGIIIGKVMSNNMVTDTISEHATIFLDLYNGTPPNSDGTPDVRSNVFIDGVSKIDPDNASNNCWTWQVDSGSTLSCNLNVSKVGVS